MWINKGTRFFVIEVVLYSSNTGQFAVLQFQVDMRITGSLRGVELTCGQTAMCYGSIATLMASMRSRAN